MEASLQSNLHAQTYQDSMDTKGQTTEAGGDPGRCEQRLAPDWSNKTPGASPSMMSIWCAESLPSPSCWGGDSMIDCLDIQD